MKHILLLLLTLCWMQTEAQTITVAVKAGPLANLNALHKQTILPFIDSVNCRLAKGKYIVSQPTLRIAYDTASKKYTSFASCTLTPQNPEKVAKLKLTIGTAWFTPFAYSTLKSDDPDGSYHIRISRRGSWYHAPGAKDSVQKFMKQQPVKVTRNCNTDEVVFTDYNGYLYCKEVFYKEYYH